MLSRFVCFSTQVALENSFHIALEHVYREHFVTVDVMETDELFTAALSPAVSGAVGQPGPIHVRVPRGELRLRVSVDICLERGEHELVVVVHARHERGIHMVHTHPNGGVFWKAVSATGGD